MATSKLWPLLILALPVTAARGQDSPVTWTFEMEITGNYTGILVIKASLCKGWWILADNPGLRMAGPYLITPSGWVTLLGPLRAKDLPERMDDPGLGAQVNGYGKDIIFYQPVMMAGHPAPFPFTLWVTVSNGRALLPLGLQVQHGTRSVNQ